MDASPTDGPTAHTLSTEDPVEQVDRTVELDVDAEELWELVSTAEGWSRWLTDTADLEVEPGALGDVTDGDAAKRVRVDAVEPGRRIGFTWWSDNDPTDAATVELRIEDVSVTARRLHIIERRLMPSMTNGGTILASSTLSTVAAGGGAMLQQQIVWETRLWLLATCSLARLSMSPR